MISAPLINRTVTIVAFCVLISFACILFFIRRSADRNPLQQLPFNLQKYLAYENIGDINESVDIHSLKIKLEKLNYIRNITNLDKYAAMDDDTPIFIVQVHQDIKRLQYLILSLAQVRDIQTILLIFSHSFYHKSIDRLIRSIDFCKTMQIYYPHSLQLNPYKFPGIDVEDCTPGATAAEPCAVRDARLTEHKQHWWWKANFVFHRTEWSRTHRAPVIFLEENNYVAPDMVHMLQYMKRTFQYFPHVEVMSFGRPLTKTVTMDLLVVEPWRPPFDVGMAFNRTSWSKMQSFSAQYCMYNDHSWSYSLFNLLENFPSGSANMVACMTPRVVSTKEYTDLHRMWKKFSIVFNHLDMFPERVRAVYLFGRDGRVQRTFKTPPLGNGGWNDLRDQVLCLDPLFTTSTEEKRYDEAEITRL